MRKIFFLLSLIFISTQAQARPWPETFSRQQYHRYYIENRLVQSMPLSLPNLQIQAGKPAYLSFITSYVFIPMKGKDIGPYMPPLHCNIKGNIPFYEHWTYMIAVDKPTYRDCE